jgi:hypothetical protein
MVMTTWATSRLGQASRSPTALEALQHGDADDEARQHQRRDEEGRDRVAAGKAAAHQRDGAERAEHQRDQRRESGDLQRGPSEATAPASPAAARTSAATSPAAAG